MIITPAIRFHRIVKRFERFVDPADISIGLPYQKLVLNNEKILGAYRGDSAENDIIFTDNGFVFTEIQTGDPRRILYSELRDLEFPLPTSDSVDLTLKLKDSTNVQVRVVGRQGTFRDVFEMGRFFRRVITDAAKVRQTSNGLVE